jgi:hypothetical protein
MPLPRLRPVILAACVVACYLTLLRQSGEIPENTPGWQTLPSEQRKLAETLVKAGWLPRTAVAAAESVGEDGCRSLGAPALARLEGLGRLPEVMSALDAHPEFSTICAASNRPLPLASILGSGLPPEAVNRIGSSFLAAQDVSDLDDWVDGLDLHRKPLLRFMGRTSVPMLMKAYTFDRRSQPDAAAKTDAWLGEFLDAEPPQDDEFASRLYFAADTARDLAKHLGETDTVLAAAFGNEWPNFRPTRKSPSPSGTACGGPALTGGR